LGSFGNKYFLEKSIPERDLACRSSPAGAAIEIQLSKISEPLLNAERSLDVITIFRNRNSLQSGNATFPDRRTMKAGKIAT